MDITDFKIGDKIEIVMNFRSKSKIKNPAALISQIEDVQDGLIFISMPVLYGEAVHLKKDSNIKVIIYKEDKGIFSFIGEVVSRIQRNIVMYGVKPLSKFEKEQRRFYFRLSTRSKITIKSRDRDFVETCYTKDISGGGVRIACSNEFNKNEKVICFINIDGEIVNVTGEIVRKEKNFYDNSNELGINFIEITDNDRNKIVSYIFKEQRLLRKKGLI